MQKSCFSGFELDKVPDNLDTIVIGSGSGGLTTALLLARAGQNVVVLEQQKKAGGCCHTFVEKGYEFDTGAIPVDILPTIFFYYVILFYFDILFYVVYFYMWPNFWGIYFCCHRH